MAERETAVYVAKLAEQTERYDEMVDAMKSVALMDVELTAEERNLLSVGYKNMIASRRASCRILSSIEHKEESKGHQLNNERIREYIGKVETEITKICDDFNSILDDHVIPSCNSAEDYVFYYKMIGDSYMYRAGDDRIKVAKQSLATYQTATTIAELELSGTNPVRLGLALNFSVLYYQIFNLPESAWKIADKAIDIALSDIDAFLNEESPEESLQIMLLLMNNLILWNARILEDEEENAANNNGGDDAE